MWRMFWSTYWIIRCGQVLDQSGQLCAGYSNTTQKYQILAFGPHKPTGQLSITLYRNAPIVTKGTPWNVWALWSTIFANGPLWTKQDIVLASCAGEQATWYNPADGSTLFHGLLVVVGNVKKCSSSTDVSRKESSNMVIRPQAHTQCFG